MDDTMDQLVVNVRATTDGFASDMAQMRGTLDTNLVDGFEKAGAVLERGLSRAIRNGSLGFDDLKRIALQALDQIAAQAMNLGFESIFGGQQQGGAIPSLASLFTSFLGSPGRATGGPVSPGRAFIVGERGPEVFVPTSAGRVETGLPGQQPARDVKVSIQLNTPRGTSAPTAMRRSSRQIASSLRRALQDA